MTGEIQIRSRSAEVSSCGRYRYHLRRAWNLRPPPKLSGPALFVMLNPSTADEREDDPTIRRCLRFSARFGATSLEAVNLYALRVAEPAELELAYDPIGPATDRWIADAASRARYVIVAWGAHRQAAARETIVWDLLSRSVPLDVPIHCLGRTRDGSPRHPLYVRHDAKLDLWWPGG